MSGRTTLDGMGLHRGEAVRFRRHEGGRWNEGRVAAVASDGSITVHDADGAARSLRPERLEVRRPGRRGTLEWQPVTRLEWEQLSLWDPEARAPTRRRRSTGV